MKNILKIILSAVLTVGLIVGMLPQEAVFVRAEEPVEDGLTGFWTFDGASEAEQLESQAGVSGIAAEKTGNGVTLMAEGGISGGCAYFSGNNASWLTLNLADAQKGLAASQNAFTIGAWVKYEEVIVSGNAGTSIFHQDGQAQGRAILTIGKNGGNTVYGTYLDGTNRYSGQIIETGQWHHVMIAVEENKSSRKVYIYVNGELANGTGQTFASALIDGSGNIRVGAHRNNADNPAMKGWMDEIRYYDRVLSAEEVKGLYDVYGREEQEEPVSVAVNTKETLREVPAAMFGINHRYHRDAYGTWDAEENQVYGAFTEMAKEAGFGSVRYPGGTVSNLFTWKDTIGPKEERTPTIAGNNFYSTAGEVPVEPGFGTDEAMQWIYDDLGAEAVFVYGLGRGNPSDAADLVEYLNAPNDGSNPNGGVDWAAERAKNGHEEPYGVVRFELGNEFGDVGQNYWMAGKPASQSVVDAYINGGTMTYTHNMPIDYYQNCGYTVKKGDWRTAASLSEGKPDEERYVCYLPVTEGSVKVYVNNEEWEIRDSLLECGAENVCTFDYETGKITFGDGVNGNIPQAGKRITVDYQSVQAGFADYYDAMKETAEKIGIEIEVYSGIGSGHQRSFISKMNECGYNDKYDGVILHPYSSGVTGYKESLARAKSHTNNVAAHKQAMLETTQDEDKKVAVSEFGILSVSPDSSYQSSLGHAIYIANHMIDAVNAGAAYQEKHCLVDFAGASDNLGNWQQCVIQSHAKEDGGYDYVSTPSARLFSIFRNMTGDTQVGQTVTGNKSFNGEVQNVNVYSTTDDGGNTYVMAVNNKENDTVSFNFSIDERDLTGEEIEVWSLGSENVTDINTKEDPDKVAVQKETVTAEGSSFSCELTAHSVYSFKIPVEKVTITAQAAEGGSAEPAVQEVRPGSSVTVTAKPDDGYEFAGWFSGDQEVSGENPYTFDAAEDTGLTATFKKKEPEDVTPPDKEPGGNPDKEPGGNPDKEPGGTPDTKPGGTPEPKPNPVVTEKDKTPPLAPAGVKAQKKKKGILLSWKKVKGANGYAIYRSYKKKTGYKKVTVISKAGTKQYLDKKGKKGKMAYYKIKAYKISDGKKIWGKYSKIVKKKR